MEKDKIIESLESRLSDLDEERQKIMDRLIQLEEEELKEKFHVNDCFIDHLSCVLLSVYLQAVSYPACCHSVIFIISVYHQLRLL